jgi:CRP-like cAMP-binding protein
VSTIADLCDGLPVASFEPGAILIPEGPPTGRIYVLLDGMVEVVKGDFQINLVFDRGAVFGEMSALLDEPHMATVRAVTAARAFVSERGVEFLRDHPERSYLVAQMLAQRLSDVTGYLVDLKSQFEDQKSHLGMVDEILEALLHEQRRAFTPGSDRDPGY